jgi:RNA polymerase sigma factor (sigma-70 family)
VNLDPQEQALLKRLAANDSEAAKIIYQDNFKMVQAYVLNNNGSFDDARDIFQEAMIVLYEHAKNDQFVLTAQISTYVYSVARRLWLKRLQQMKRYATPVESIGETVAVDEDLETHEKNNADMQMMESALQKLGEPCKSLIEAYYMKKKGMLEIAEQFGYTNADNAKNQKYKCLVRLKKIFFTQPKMER